MKVRMTLTVTDSNDNEICITKHAKNDRWMQSVTTELLAACELDDILHVAITRANNRLKSREIENG
jgi:hypothetical protein